MLAADISYSTDGLLIKLYDASVGTPATWAWDIVDADSASVHDATDPNTEYTFLTSGVFKIIHTVTNATDPVSSTSIHVKVDLAAETILYDISVMEMVSNLVPDSIFEAEIELIQDLKYKWQEILWEGLSIPFAHIHNEDEWPALANLLIAYLISRDLIIMEVNAILTQTSTAGGGTKKIVTGPTEAEKFQASSVYKEMFGSEGAFEEFTNQICGIASRLQVFITGCKIDFIAPLKVYYTGDYSYEHKYIWDLPQFYLRHNE